MEGIKLTVGTALSRTVNSAFATLSERIKGTGAELADVTRKSKLLDKATKLKSLRDALGQQIIQARKAGQSTTGLLRELHKANAEYRTVTASVKGFGIGLNQVGAAQKMAAAQSGLLAKKLAALNTLSQANAERMNLMGRAMSTYMSALAFAAPIKSAMELEEIMASTATAFNGARDSSGKLTDTYYKMEESIKSLSTELGVGADKLAQLTANAGDDGVKDIAELEARLRAVAQVAKSYGMSLDEADSYYRQLSKSMNMSADEIARQLDLYNALSGANGVAEPPIMKIVSQLAEESKAAKVSADTMAALAATMAGLRVDSGKAEGGLRKMLQVLSAGENATKAQKEAFAELGLDAAKMAEYMEKDSSAVILTLLSALKKLPPAARNAKLQEIFGPKQAASILPLIENLDKVRENLELAGDAAEYTGNLQKKFNNVTDNAAFAWDRVTASMKIAMANIGQVVLPTLKSVFEFVANFTGGIAKFAQEHQTLTSILVGGAAAFVGIKIAALGFSAVIATGRTAMAAYTVAMTTIKGAMLAWSVATKGITAAQIALNVAMAANPIGLAVVAVTALTAGFAYLWQNCETFREICKAAFEIVTIPIRTVIGCVQALFGNFSMLAGVADTIKKAFSSAFSFITSAIEKVSGPLEKLFSFFGDDDEVKESAEKKAEAIEERAEELEAEPPAPPAPPLPSYEPPEIPDYMPPDLPAAEPRVPRSSSPSSVTVKMDFNIDGMPAETLAEGVIRSLEIRQDDFIRLINDAISEGQRVTYDG